MKRANKWLGTVLFFIPVLCLLVVWAISSAIIDNEYILPSIGETFNALLSILQSGEFYYSLLSTLLRSLIAFLISFILATILAYIANQFKKVERIIMPFISIMRALPTIAVVLLLLFWTNSQVAPVIVTMLVVFPTLYTSSKTAFDGVDKQVLEIGAVAGADRKAIFKNIIFPISLPDILIEIGAGISLNIKLMVAAEVLSATANSIGYLLNTSKAYFEVASLMALVSICVVIGVVVEVVFNKISSKVGEWR